MGEVEGRNLAVLVLLCRSKSSAELQHRVNLKVTRAWDREDERELHLPPDRRSSGFELKSLIPRNLPAEKHVDDVLSRVLHARAAIRKLVDEIAESEPDTDALRLWVYIEAPAQTVALDLSPQQLSTVVALGAYVGMQFETLDKADP